MMFLWEPQMIRFMKDASEYGTYYAELAERVLSLCPPGPVVCDAGCGLGYLSLALADGSRSVTAVDINADVLALLDKNAALRGYSNISTICAEICSIPEELTFDAMVFCFFGTTEVVLEAAGRSRVKKTFVIRRRLLPGDAPERQRSALGLEYELLRRGIPHESYDIDTRLDQPFRNEHDAVEFFNTYRPREPYRSMDEADFLGRLVSVEHPEFTCVLPIEKPLTMTVFESGAL